jgi:WD40 repeat protein
MRRDAGAVVRWMSRYLQTISHAPVALVALLALCLVTGCQVSSPSQATQTPSPTPTIPVTRITTTNATRLKRLSSLNIGDGIVRSVAWAPNGSMLAVGSAHHVRLLAASTEGREVILPGDTGIVDALAWSPDGVSLAAGDEDGGVYVWNVATRMLRAALRMSGPPVFAAAWSPDGAKLATGDGSGHVTIWNTATGAQLGSWFGDARGRFHESSRSLAVYGVGWSPDGTLLAISRGFGLLQVWDIASGKELAAVAATTDKKQLRGAAWSPDGLYLVTGGDDGTVRLWGVPV